MFRQSKKHHQTSSTASTCHIAIGIVTVVSSWSSPHLRIRLSSALHDFHVLRSPVSTKYKCIIKHHQQRHRAISPSAVLQSFLRGLRPSFFVFAIAILVPALSSILISCRTFLFLFTPSHSELWLLLPMRRLRLFAIPPHRASLAFRVRPVRAMPLLKIYTPPVPSAQLRTLRAMPLLKICTPPVPLDLLQTLRAMPLLRV